VAGDSLRGLSGRPAWYRVGRGGGLGVGPPGGGGFGQENTRAFQGGPAGLARFVLEPN